MRCVTQHAPEGYIAVSVAQGALPDPRTPLTLRAAMWAWRIAGLIFVAAPPLAALLLWRQYSSLRKSGNRVAALSGMLDPMGKLDLRPYMAEAERVESWLASTSGPALVLLAVLYLFWAAVCATGFVLISKGVVRGAHWARVMATVLAALCIMVTLFVWQMFATMMWLPIDALGVNHLGLVIIALQIVAVVLVWLPASNEFVRRVRLTRLTRTPQLTPPTQPAPPAR